MNFHRHGSLFLPSLVALLLVGAQIASVVPADASSLKGRVQVAPLPPALSVDAVFTEPSGNSILDAEEAGKITVTVKNDGAGDGYDVVGNRDYSPVAHDVEYALRDDEVIVRLAK